MNLARTSTPAPSIETGLTIMEAVSHVAGVPLSERPSCTSVLLAKFVSDWADDLDDVERDRLFIPLVPHLVGAHRVNAAYFGHLAMAWLLRDALPAWLRVAGFDDAAKFETGLPAPNSPAAIAAWTDELGALGRFIPHVLGNEFGDELGGLEIARQVLPRLKTTGEAAAVAVIEDLFSPGSPVAQLADRALTICHLAACLGCARAAKTAVAAARGGDVELAAAAAVARTYEPARIERQLSALGLVERMTVRRISA
jgi:hypothetical protein